MSSTLDRVKTFNSLLRTVVALCLLVAVVAVGAWGYSTYVAPSQQVDRLKNELAALQTKYKEQRIQLETVRTALKLMKVDRRMARVRVLETGSDKDSAEAFMEVEFVELGRDGEPLCEPRQFRLRGDVLYINTLVVKFKDHFVEKADEFRGASLCLFKSIYGNLDGPEGGYSLDRRNMSQQTIYGKSDEQAAFENQIWKDFWAIANDPQRREELGIKANHGEGLFMEVAPGMTYKVDLRASGGVSIYSEDDPEWVGSR